MSARVNIQSRGYSATIQPLGHGDNRTTITNENTGKQSEILTTADNRAFTVSSGLDKQIHGPGGRAIAGKVKELYLTQKPIVLDDLANLTNALVAAQSCNLVKSVQGPSESQQQAPQMQILSASAPAKSTGNEL